MPFINSDEMFEKFAHDWTSWSTRRVSSWFNLLNFHRKLKQTLATCGWHRAKLVPGNIWKIQQTWTCQVLVDLFCHRKYNFWFLMLMLRNSEAKICWHKLCTKIKIAQPQGQLGGKLSLICYLKGGKLKMLLRIYNFECKLGCV